MMTLVFLVSFLAQAGALEIKASPPHLRVPAPVVTPLFKSYKDWKNEQIQFWQSRGQSDMAKDFTVADYFAGYLTKQKDQNLAIKEVSGRLSADEVAELMTIYANSVFGSRNSQLPARAEITGKEAKF